MPRVAAHCSTDPAHPRGHVLAHAWPDDCTVQWGGSGVVFAKDNAYATAFFEAFPKSGGFIRGEGPTVAEAETDAFAQLTREAACAHRWQRRKHTNGGAFCAACDAFKVVFHPLVTLGAWRKPLSAMELDMVAMGSPFVRAKDDAETIRSRRRLFLRTRKAGIDIPAPDPAVFADEDAYSLVLSKIVVDHLRAHPEFFDAEKAEMDGNGGVGGFFQGESWSSLRWLLKDPRFA